MNKILKALTAVGGAAAAALGVTPAFAAGTAVGTDITNQASVSFTVGGVGQTPVNSNIDTFKVDRKVTVVVAEIGTVTTSVVPGATNQVTAFRVTNTSNATIDIGLTAAQQAGGTAAHGGTDAFDVTGLTMYRDVNGNGTYEAGTDTAITFIDELAADGVVDILLVGNIPAGATNGQVAGVNLQGQARESGAAGTQGAVLAATAGANGQTTVETVLVDAANTIPGAGADIANDGKSTDSDDFTVQAASITVAKASRVTTDGINVAPNAKAIPGATVEYCIAVTNAAGGQAASGLTVTDNIPANTTYVPGSARQGATVAGGVCTGGSATGTTFTATPVPQVTGTIGTVAAGATLGFSFQVTIN